MNGFIIEFKAFDNASRIKLYHMLFGRNIYQEYRGRKTAYYVPGMLDKTPFCRIVERKIFVTSLVNINIDQLKVLAEVTIEEVDKDFSMEKLVIGEDYWYNIAVEKGVEFKRQLKTRRKRCKTETAQTVTY